MKYANEGLTEVTASKQAKFEQDFQYKTSDRSSSDLSTQAVAGKTSIRSTYPALKLRCRAVQAE